jgi:hypothetical protein
VSALSVAGLLKHAANTERGWIVGTMLGQFEAARGRSGWCSTRSTSLRKIAFMN